VGTEDVTPDPATTPEPLVEALRLINMLRRDIRKAIQPLEVLCDEERCTEWARFRSETSPPRTAAYNPVRWNADGSFASLPDPLFCTEHARIAQRERGAKLWYFAQPDIVYTLHRSLMRYTTAERIEKRNAAFARLSVDQGYTMAELELRLGRDLVIEPAPGSTPDDAVSTR
jgi:hypothetical protein